MNAKQEAAMDQIYQDHSRLGFNELGTSILGSGEVR